MLILTAYWKNPVRHFFTPEIEGFVGYRIENDHDLIRRVLSNEYKRHQNPPGLKVTEKAFSIGRRFPIVQKWV